MFMEETEKKDQSRSGAGSALYILGAAVLVLGMLSLVLYQKNRTLTTQLSDQADLLELEQYVEENYYQDVDEDTAMDGALKGYVAGLNDPYSSFLTDDEYNDWKTMESGSSVGIGVTVQASGEDGMLVVEVTADSPAEEAGVKAEDIITAVDGVSVADLGFTDAVAAVKGEAGTEVVLTITRGTQQLDCTVTRAEIATVTAFGTMLEGDIGYIRISAFRENTNEQFQSALQTLLDDGAKALIFDVRDNGGGLLSALEEILDPLLPEGEIAVAHYGNGTVKTIVESDAQELDLPMTVLINENTASAAELFAASLHDFEKATLVGTTTFGKGIMQDTQRVSGGAVTLTVATYQTTKGECYQGIGVSPDEEVALEDGVTVDYTNPDLTQDTQLQSAYQALQNVVDMV
jgi:carboxyl-terminal processing protease